MTWIRAELAMVRRFMFSKTMVGAYVNALGYATSPDFYNLLPAKWAKALQVGGGLLMALGVRHAISKSGEPTP